MKIVVDGNDGTGKTTLVKALRALGHDVADRGLPTKMTDDPSIEPRTGEVYLILDAPVEVCRKRLALAGKDLQEPYHTVVDLTHYRQRFLEVAQKLLRCAVIEASGSCETVLEQAEQAIAQLAD